METSDREGYRELMYFSINAMNQHWHYLQWRIEEGGDEGGQLPLVALFWGQRILTEAFF